MLLPILLIGCGGGGGSGNSYSSNSIGITIDPSSTKASQIDISPSAVSIRPGQTISVSFLIKDAYGHPLDGIDIQLASQLGGTFEDQNGQTSKGWFSTRFTAGTTIGTEAIIALANGKMFTKSLAVQVLATSKPVIQLTTSSSSTVAETAITVAAGVSIDGANADGTSVLLSSTIPGSFDSNSGEITKGWFITSFTPNSSAEGVGTITAIVQGEKADIGLTVTKQKKESPQLSISVNPDAVFQDQSAAVIVIAKDSSGSPSNAKVYFSSSLDGSFSNTDGTPEDGVFYTEFTAGKEVGSATITVFSMNSSASTILSIERPEFVMKINPSVSTVKVDEKVPVSVLVTDTYSRPINNAQVYLQANLGCLCEEETGTTNSDGYFFFNFIASQTAGISTIRGLTAGATATANITVVGP